MADLVKVELGAVQETHRLRVGEGGHSPLARPQAFAEIVHRLEAGVEERGVHLPLGGLRRGGVVISLGATDEPIELSAFYLLFKQLGVDGALTGSPAAGDATLRFSAISGVAVARFALGDALVDSAVRCAVTVLACTATLRHSSPNW